MYMFNKEKIINLSNLNEQDWKKEIGNIYDENPPHDQKTRKKYSVRYIKFLKI